MGFRVVRTVERFLVIKGEGKRNQEVVVVIMSIQVMIICSERKAKLTLSLVV